jgi:hypothetical protein
MGNEEKMLAQVTDYAPPFFFLFDFPAISP